MIGLIRRRFIAFAVLALALVLTVPAVGMAQLPGGTLDPLTIPKYVTPLVIPPPMPKTSSAGNLDYYEIAVRQFEQQILPPADIFNSPLPPTTVWSYGSANHPGTFNYPAFTIEATVDKPVRVKWINDLKDASGNFLPHLLAVDRSLHWANPEMLLCMDGTARTDCRPDESNGEILQQPYLGPVPIVTHVHGAHVGPESDGFAEAWFLPAANDIPIGYARKGARFDQFDRNNTQPGSALFQYPNDQRATTLWYHDHTLGMTRLNVYAGPAGFYLLRGGPDDLESEELPGPAPAHGDAAGMKYYEIPIAIQDRSFNADGSLFYPDSRSFFDSFFGPYIPFSDISPLWNPEFFGNTIVVNGKTWPRLDVEPRRYRFRFLNGCNSRFLILKIASNPMPSIPATPALPFTQIGAEGGFLPAPVQLDQLVMGLAERADVIVDFSDLPIGTELYLINEGPDEPFGGGVPGTDFPVSDPFTTGQVMKFVVVASASTDDSEPADELELPAFTPLGPETVTRRLSLNEEMSMTTCVDENNVAVDCSDPASVGFAGPVAALLGTLDSTGTPVPMLWMDPITEDPILNDTEIWEIHNFTVDAHPIHLHLVAFQVIGREAFGGGTSIAGQNTPLPWETGYKDTVIAFPGEITRIKAKFDIAGLYVWHCHIVEHEDNEMMRPYMVRFNPDFPDFDQDGDVDSTDYAILLQEIRKAAPRNPAYDLNRDGKVDLLDARFFYTVAKTL